MNNEIPKTYVISDTHFGHKKMEQYCNRPEDFGQQIIDNWKATVRLQDTIYHLGDVIWGNKKQLTSILSDLPGRKFLIKGNHDFQHSDNWFITAGFTGVFSEVVIRMHNIRYRLTHFPVFQTMDDTINIHGHFHNADSKYWENSLKHVVMENTFLFTLEKTNYFPILLETAVSNKEVIPTQILILPPAKNEDIPAYRQSKAECGIDQVTE